MNMEIIDEYLNYLEYNKNYSLKTIDNYRIDLVDYFNYLEKECLDYKEVEYEDLMGLFDHFDKLKLSAKSIRRHISSLKGFYKYLNRKNIVNDNQFDYIILPKK